MLLFLADYDGHIRFNDNRVAFGMNLQPCSTDTADSLVDNRIGGYLFKYRVQMLTCGNIPFFYRQFIVLQVGNGGRYK